MLNKYSQIIISILKEKSIWNIVFFILIFPYYLYLIKQNSFILFSYFNLIWTIIFFSYFIYTFRKSFSLYQIPVSFFLGSVLFMKVTAGNTIPSWIVILFLTLSMFITQEVISYREFVKFEFSKEIILSNIVLSNFILYSYLFGSIFVNNLNSFILAIICFIYNTNIFIFFFHMYNLRKNFILSLFISFITVQLFVVLRLMPYSHLTLSILLNIFVIFSIISCKDIYLKKISLMELLTRTVIFVVIIIIILFTANKTVI